MYLVTLASNTFQYEFVVLFTAAKALGWNVIAAGVGENWKGWRTKMEVYAKEIQKIADQEPEALVVCADAYDVLVLRSPEDFAKLFLEFDTDVVVSAETHCGSNCRKLNNYPTDGPRKYVNAGLLCGRAKQVARLWSALLETNWHDDQIALSEYMDSNKVALDTEAKLLQTRVREEISNETIDGLGPAFLHLPGLNDHKDQRDMYSFVLTEVSKRLQLDHLIAMRWATRTVPFKGDLFFHTLIAALIIVSLIALLK